MRWLSTGLGWNDLDEAQWRTSRSGIKMALSSRQVILIIISDFLHPSFNSVQSITMRFAAGAIALLLSAVNALPVANPKAQPEASPDTAAGHTEYGDYGEYTNYPRDSEVAQYDDYGTYKRDNEVADYGDYGTYDNYKRDEAAGHTEYGDYGEYTNYKREENKDYGNYGKYTDYPSNYDTYNNYKRDGGAAKISVYES